MYKEILIIILSIFVFQSCYNSTEDKISNNQFSISLGTFKNYEQASSFRTFLDDDVRAQLRLEFVSSKNYKLLYGKFSTSYSAGETAYRLFEQNKIKRYDIVLDGHRVLDEFANIPFIANYLGKPVLFNYYLKNKTVELLLNIPLKKIMSVNLNKEANNAFITTSRNYGNNGTLPFIEDGELYILRRNNEYLEKLFEYGNGMKIYTYWDYPDTFRTNFLHIDSSNARIIYQEINSWDKTGKEGKKNERSFDIVKQGIPVIPKRKPSLFSPKNNYQLRILEEKGSTFFYLKDFQDKSDVFISLSKNKIYDARWTDDEEYLFIIAKSNDILTAQIKDKDEIFIINTKQKIVTKKLFGTGFNNLLVRGKLLFFDEMFKSLNRINIFDFEKIKDFGTIEYYGGCSLNSIPK